jgi:hypothetical protein
VKWKRKMITKPSNRENIDKAGFSTPAL